MKKAEATRYGRALEAAGLITSPGTEGKLPKGLRVSHGSQGLTGWSTETGRHVFIVCVDVAEALLASGWSNNARRACTWSWAEGHTG
jgi:hypothetical protein